MPWWAFDGVKRPSLTATSKAPRRVLGQDPGELVFGGPGQCGLEGVDHAGRMPGVVALEDPDSWSGWAALIAARFAIAALG
jgi:hypothetical protein